MAFEVSASFSGLSFSQISQEQVVITVGKQPNVKFFHVFEQLLCDVSPYFTAAFTCGKWKEAQNGALTLEDTVIEDFTLFLHWLYFGRVPLLWDKYRSCFCCTGECKQDIKADHKLDFDDFAEADIEHLETTMSHASPAINLYIFADRYDIPLLRENLVDFACHMLRHHAICDQILLWGCQQLPKHSRLHQLFADALIWRFDVSGIRCRFDQLLCKRLSSTMWLRAFAAASTPNGWACLRSLCTYHEHDLDLDCMHECESAYKDRVDNMSVRLRVRKKIATGISQGIADKEGRPVTQPSQR